MSSQNNKSNKYGKKTTFSREKSYANSEFDIEKNDKKADKYRNERLTEREYNIKVASGIEDDEDNDVYAENKQHKEENEQRKEENEQFYYEKMNLIVHNLQASRNLDAILKEFTPYGKISYVTYSSVTNNVKLVVDQWYDDDVTFIVDVQCAIFKDGIYKSIGNMNITKDPEQSIREMGDKIIMEN